LGAKLFFISFFIFFLTGCSVTSHPQYQQTYFKRNIDESKIQTIKDQFRKSGLQNASIERDSLGRVQLTGTYENEEEVRRAFLIVESSVGSENVSKVRPEQIKVYNWEIEANKEFTKFIQKLVAEYKLSAIIETDGLNKQINIANLGFDGEEQFPFSSDKPSQKATEFYAKFAKKLVESNKNKNASKKILIVGHTDDVGDSKYNAQLSDKRARAVGKIFAENGFDSGNIFYQGAGETYPIATNETKIGRSKNRRVEFTELSGDEDLKLFTNTRRPRTDFYRYQTKQSNFISESNDEKKIEKIENRNSLTQTKKNDPSAKPNHGQKTEDLVITSPQNIQEVTKINFAGVPYSAKGAILDTGGPSSYKPPAFNFISHANSSNLSTFQDCSLDRPRYSGQIKSLGSDVPKKYNPNDYVRGLRGKAWYDLINGHLLLLNNVYIEYSNIQNPDPAKVLIYQNYKNEQKQKPEIEGLSQVNGYIVANGILYRLFIPQGFGLVCLDILFSVDKIGTSNDAILIYNTHKGKYMAKFNPRLSE
jgi:outer membrane protein OmpA-like peptidoglycan-associated protein